MLCVDYDVITDLVVRQSKIQAPIKSASPSMSNPRETISVGDHEAPNNCLSRSLQSMITVETRPNRGRCAIYNGAAPLKPGYVVMTCLPIATRNLGTENRHKYCTFCLSKSSSSTSLQRCSQCKHVYYCSRECQRADYKIDRHKLECSLLASRWRDKFVGEENSQPGLPRNQEQALDDVCLLFRTMLYIRQENNLECREIMEETEKCQNRKTRAYLAPPAVKCGKAHWDSMDDSVSIWDNEIDKAFRMSIANEVSCALKIALAGTKSDASNVAKPEEIIVTMRRFSANNFSIFNQMLVPIAAGVYPWSAVLNHSCVPNCIVRYEIKPKALPRLVFVATREIQPGEELCHSYVDLMLEKETHIKELSDKYGIVDCGCTSSLGDKLVPWPYGDIGDNTCFDYDPFLWETCDASSDCRTTIAWDEVYNAGNASCDEQEVLSCVNEADAALRNDDDKAEHFHLKHALTLHDRKCLPPLGPLAYRINGRLLSSCLVHGQLCGALGACKRIVCCICIAMTAHGIQYHPLLGLQLFTLADLYEGTGDQEMATRAYIWAWKVLAVSHGEQSELVHRLDSFLSK